MRRLLMVALTAGVLAVPSIGGSVVIAAPTCDGKAATIVGTAGDDFIEGTNGPDVIVGLGGSDSIFGMGGRDIICGGAGTDGIQGGGGRDRIFGGAGDDVLFGGAGPDFISGGPGQDSIFGGDGNDVLRGGDGPDSIRGEAGNDTIDGGPASDDCKQGPGSGPIRNCEKADLKVVVQCPANAAEDEDITCTVKVRNRGPQASSYTLIMSEGADGGDIDCHLVGGIEDEPIKHGVLGADRTRKHVFDIPCDGGGGVAIISADLFTHARDPRPANNHDEAFIDFS